MQYGFASDRGIGEVATKRAEIIRLDNGANRIEVPLGFDEGAANPPRPGFRGKPRLDTSQWNIEVP